MRKAKPKKYFNEQRSILFDGVSKISIKSYRIELIGSHAFQNHSKFSLLGNIGAVFKQSDIEVEYKEQLYCIAQAGVFCPPFVITNKDDVNKSMRVQYGIGAQYQLNKNISARFMAKSIVNGFSFSSGTPYLLSFGLQYHF